MMSIPMTITLRTVISEHTFELFTFDTDLANIQPKSTALTMHISSILLIKALRDIEHLERYVFD